MHGTFEGRELGRQKGFEVWEEVGFYEGTTRFWLEAITRSTPDEAKRTRKQTKQVQHLGALLALIEGFPMANDVIPEGSAAAEDDDKDMATLLERIRARYKLTCSVLGVRPRGANGEIGRAHV